jgi:hypothetical protein
MGAMQTAYHSYFFPTASSKTIHGVSLSMSGKEMNVINAIRDYVYKIIESVPGMKVLMLDHETVIFLAIFLVLCLQIHRLPSWE